MEPSNPTYSLRYYSWDEAIIAHLEAPDADEYQKAQLAAHYRILDYLRVANNRHGIDVDVFYVASTSGPIGGPYTDEADEKRLYRQHFVPRASVLKARLGESLARTLRADRGRGHYHVAGSIAILEDGQVGWVTGVESCGQHFDLPLAELSIPLGLQAIFLRAVCDRGVSLLQQICFPVTGTPEQILIDSFLRSSTLKGDYKRELPVGFLKMVDLVYYSSDCTWILEAKTILSFEAFGQVMAYSWLYARDHPDEKIRRGIICSSRDDELEEVCRAPEFAVTVFIESTNGFLVKGHNPGNV